MGVQPVLRYETLSEGWKPQFSWQQEKWWATLLCLGQPWDSHVPTQKKRKYLRANKLIDADRLELWGRNWKKLEEEENMMNWVKELGKRCEQFGKTELCKTWILLLFPPALLQVTAALPGCPWHILVLKLDKEQPWCQGKEAAAPKWHTPCSSSWADNFQPLLKC